MADRRDDRARRDGGHHRAMSGVLGRSQPDHIGRALVYRSPHPLGIGPCLAPMALGEPEDHRCQCGCGEVIRATPPPLLARGSPRRPRAPERPRPLARAPVAGGRVSHDIPGGQGPGDRDITTLLRREREGTIYPDRRDPVLAGRSSGARRAPAALINFRADKKDGESSRSGQIPTPRYP